MSILRVNASVVLCKTSEGYSIEVETADRQQASISLGNHGPLVNQIMETWANEQVQKAMNARQNTGLTDVTGRPVLEGDIVERFDLPGHTEVFGVVKWDDTRAAFVMQGLWPDEKLWWSQNLRAVGAARIVGNIFLDAGILKPCKLIQPENSQDVE